MIYNISVEITPEQINIFKEMLLNSKAKDVEDQVFDLCQKGASEIFKDLINEVTNSSEGIALVRKIKKRKEYRVIRRKKIEVVVKDGNHIKVDSWYGLGKERKRGKVKKGRNGTGVHILLSYFGFSGKRSPGYINQVTRTAVASASYELASEELLSRGIKISNKAVSYLTQEIGGKAYLHGNKLLLEKGESFSDKRVCISLDGGRVRVREKSRKKGSKRLRFETPWREPKLLVIYELDDKGNKKRGEKPLYEATMKTPEEVYLRLKDLCARLGLTKAKEIICIADGSDWIWNIFERLIKELKIEDKTTKVADYFHAVEHLTEIAELTGETEREQKEWVSQLASYLKEGKFYLVKQLINVSSEKLKKPEMIHKFSYFDKRREYMRYDEYLKRAIPIGSGIVESAIKRVINHKLKSPGIFWKMENIERMLYLRCALMAGRWNIFMNNFLQATQLIVQ